MSRKSFRIALSIVLGTILLAGAVAAYVINQALAYPDRRHPGSGNTVEVTVEVGMSFPAIAARLEAAGVIDHPRWFRLFAMDEGATTKVRAGVYQLRDDLTAREVLEKLLAGVEDVNVSLRIPEGLNFLEVAALIEKEDLAPAAEVEALCRDSEYLMAHGIGATTCEGYLFPDTYRFRARAGARVVLDRLIEQYQVVWSRVRRQHADDVAKLKTRMNWSDHELLILASLVEKEAVVDSERPRIAQVFINRLTSPSFTSRRLETDPTIRYGCTVPQPRSAACQAWNTSDRLHSAQLEDEKNPYNTYRHPGLPPGPIGNPGEASLLAAVRPDRSPYFFFVSRNDGTHVFSKTHAEHTRWVNRYQR